MRNRLIPDRYVRRIINIPTGYFKENDLRGIVIDLDNTIAPWDADFIEAPFSDWLRTVRAAGIRIVLVSNNKQERVEGFSRMIGVPWIASATKPLRAAFLQAMEMMELDREHTVVIGDQIFTDILGGNMLGLHTILVEPMASKEFIGTRVLRLLERAVLSRLDMEEEHHG